LDIRTKLVLVSLCLIAVSIVVLGLYLRPIIENQIVEGVRADLFARLALIEHDVVPLATSASRERPAWDAMADTLGQRAGLRVTLIAVDGLVLGDSEVPLAGLAEVENHRWRPEIASALAGRPGFSQRVSATVGRSLVYVALPIRVNGKIVGVARVARTLSELDHVVSRLRRALAVAAALAFAVAIIMSTVSAQLMSRALRGITQAAQRMSAGDLAVRTRIAGPDEVGQLGRALDGLAANLSSTLAALRDERDRLGRMLESMQEGVLVLDREMHIVLVNRAIREMLLLSSEVVGKTALEAIRNAELQGILDAAVTSGRPASGEVETTGLRPGRFMVHAAPLSGEPRGQVAVFVDVTEIRRLETMRKDFVANVSHELRTPITAVRSAAETVRSTVGKDPEAAMRFLEMIDRNAVRLQELVEDLLDLSRIESKEWRPEVEPVDFAPVAQQVVSGFRQGADDKRIKLTTEIPVTVRPVRADRRALEQILTNLVGNAVKYCPDGSRVAVRATQHDQVLRVSVEDNGLGIEAQHLPRVFERFYRADKGRSRDMGGTGLGLSIVKHLVEAMNGEVSVDSLIGKGTTFSFTLPTV